MPAVRVSGEIIIEDKNLFGASSFVLQQLKIGTGITLSPLSVLLHKPKDGNTYIGNPAVVVKY
jgi:acetyltransferase-like isoleucine patch superfamily enzyme